MDTKGIKETDFIKIEQRMISDLKLSGNDLIIFAFIDGFTKGVEHIYRGGLDYLCKRTGVSRRTAINILEKLTESGLLKKTTIQKGQMTYCTYSTKWCKNCTSAEVAPVQKLPDSSAEIAPVSSAKVAPNKKVYNKDNRERNLSQSASNLKIDIPTIEEIKEYAIQTNSSVNAERFFNCHDAIGWVNNYGVPIKNWKRVFDNWTMREKRKDAPKRKIDTEYEEFVKKEAQLYHIA